MKKIRYILLCMILLLSLTGCNTNQKAFIDEVEDLVKNYNEYLQEDDSLSQDITLKSARSNLRKISNMYQDAKDKTEYNEIIDKYISAEIFNTVYEYCKSTDYTIDKDLIEYFEANAEIETLSETQDPQETLTEVSDTTKPVKDIVIPDLPDDFIECQKYIGHEISIFGVDTSEWDLNRFALPIGKSSLYGNAGTVSIQLGWDDKTITNITLRLNDDEYIQGDEYDEICKKLEELFGESSLVMDGITDFSGKGNCAFRLLRNSAGIGWIGDDKDKFENAKPKKENEEVTTPEIPKIPPAIGMTAEDVRNSTWGEPSDINKTTTKYGVSEQWVYKFGNEHHYIYLDDGIVTAIQE